MPANAATRSKGVARAVGEGRSQAKAARAAASTDPSAQMIEQAIRQRGHKFGTDGSLSSVYRYAIDRHETIAPSQARVGDIVFFDTSDSGKHCGSHAGVVESVHPGGSLSFREIRDGRTLLSFVHPEKPRMRRDETGRIINSYLRRIERDDPPGTRYTAGEMLCRVVRVR